MVLHFKKITLVVLWRLDCGGVEFWHERTREEAERDNMRSESVTVVQR